MKKLVLTHFSSKNVTKCNNTFKNSKVFQKNAVIQIVRLKTCLRSYDMYNMWPGCYSFRDELKLFAMWFKDQVDSLLLKIYEFDRMLNS